MPIKLQDTIKIQIKNKVQQDYQSKRKRNRHFLMILSNNMQKYQAQANMLLIQKRLKKDLCQKNKYKNNFRK
jgi:hypothetical protein